MTKTSNVLSMNFSSEIGLKDFSFSQLIVAVKTLFDTKGVPEFIRALVILVEILLIKSGVTCPACGSDKSHQHGKTDKTVKTSLGEVCLILRRLICLGCKKTFVEVVPNVVGFISRLNRFSYM